MLLISVYDTEGLFSFEAIGLEQSNPKTIYRYEGKNTSILPISRENFNITLFLLWSWNERKRRG